MRAYCANCGDRLDAAECVRCGGRLDHPELLAPLRRRGALGEYLAGVWIALRGIRMTLFRPRLLALLVVPLAIDVALFVWLLGVYNGWAQEWAPSIGWDWLRTIVLGAVWLIAAFAAALTMLVASTAINAPFLEWLSEAVESIAIGAPDPRPLGPARIWRTVIVPIVQAAWLTVLQSLIGLALLLLSLSGVLAPLAAIGGAWLLAITLADVAISRKSYPVKARFGVIRRSLPAWLGLATPLAFVPFLLPLFVAGATLLYLRDQRLAATD